MSCTHVIWDWNGTLLDDVSWCVKVTNGMLEKRALKAFGGISDYRAAFGFPVSDYYRKIGFDFEAEPFAELAAEFISIYHSGDTANCTLHNGVVEALEAIEAKGIKQAILSASEIGNLNAQVDFFGVRRYFDDILGISDIHARSKVEIGRRYMEQEQPGKAVLIGDTTHDYETARAIGANCILVSNGHHSADALMGLGVPVVSGIAEALYYM